MDEKDWRILKVIAEEKNVTKASARLFISQPALTYRLKRIEAELGARLLTRVPTGVVLTPQGEHLLKYAEEMLIRLAIVKDQVKNIESKVEGPLRLGSSGIFAHYVLPGLFKGFLGRYPKVEISLKTALSFQIVDMLERQEISIGIVRGEHDWSGDKVLLTEEPVSLVSSEAIGPDDLLTRPHIRYGTDTSLKKMLDEWWRLNFDSPPKTTMEVNTMDIARQMVLHGLGWTMLPRIGLPEGDGLCVQPLFWPDGSPVTRRTWLFCSAPARELQTVSAFIDYAVAELQGSARR
ncbi:LysR family transcriptional regulator [uncultured Propionivibrio sp.]|uniref:LysR family transcriptional regulator n=1 Tax=uncultured Propionivibrio sp. TaxID=426737 RepID=UPI0029C0D2FA|nr:LysR family transcriptional regulator [uncultured Propionivibrio sp.]